MRGKRASALLLGLAFACALPAAGVSAQTPCTHKVSVFGKRFTPKVLTVPKGSRVCWRNGDRMEHTITFEEGRDRLYRRIPFARHQVLPERAPPPEVGKRPDSPETVPVVFERAGTYQYWCQNHFRMFGTVIVR